MRTGFMLALTVVIYLVMKEEFRVDSMGTFVVVLMPLLLLTGLAWWSDQAAAQEKRNAEFRRRQQELTSTPDAGEAPVDDGADTSTTPTTTATDRERPKAHEDGRGLVLYLRAFVADAQIRVRNPRKDSWMPYFIPFYSIMLPDDVTFDEALRWHLDERFEVLALGEQKDALGATRWTTTDDTWRRDFAILSRRARMIVIFPTTTPGTAWEIAEICAAPDLLAKTVFVVLDPANGGVDADGQPTPIRSLLGAHGCDVPEDLQAGEALLFDADGRVRHRETLITAGFLEVKVQPKALHALTDRCVAPAIVAEAA